ncbi:MAG: hypothetical protein FWE55_03155, partial [Synergistaceae bacterium]|nr:hypothetical protein [Synergistaceae bacterium]
MNEEIKRKMRSIPGMDVLLEKEWAVRWQKKLGRDAVKQVFNAELARIRGVLLGGVADLGVTDPGAADLSEDIDLSPPALRASLEALLEALERRRLRPVVNATRVVIHTNLGRSILAEEAIDAVRSAAGNYTNLEYNLDD